jgi:hypothetical protein
MFVSVIENSVQIHWWASIFAWQGCWKFFITNRDYTLFQH